MDSAEAHWRAYLGAEQRLISELVRQEQEILCPPGETRRERARRAFGEAAVLLRRCGDPQRAFPSVLIAGTSGKGSVAVHVARALSAAGLKVGLHTSPYLQVATEKIEIAGRLVSGECFAGLLDWVLPQARLARTAEAAAPAHGLASVAMAYEAFRRAEIDIAVIEIGSGGRFDLNNHVRAVTTCVTTVGLDHLQSLGPDIESIAWHKAGVARLGVPLITAARGPALEVVRAEADQVGASLVEVAPGSDQEPFPALNARLATAVIRSLPEPFSRLDAWRHLDAEAALPGRMELLEEGRVLLDGAHNPEKAGALAALLRRRGYERVVLVLGKVGSGSPVPILEALAPIAEAVVTTEPEMPARPVARAEVLAGEARRLGLPAVAEPDPARALAVARRESEARAVAGAPVPIVVTGSLFLVGQVRSLFIPRQRIVVERTPWPLDRSG
jgi:dihydrofolate synthase/folylpolyglutamate synthase